MSKENLIVGYGPNKEGFIHCSCTLNQVNTVANGTSFPSGWQYMFGSSTIVFQHRWILFDISILLEPGGSTREICFQYYLLQTNLWKYLVAASIVFRYNFQVSKTSLPIPAMFSPSEVPVKKHISTILALFGQSLLHQTDLASISRDGRCHMCHK